MFPPLSSLRFPRTLGSLIYRLFESSFTYFRRYLSCTSTPPQRLSPSRAAFSSRVLGRPEATEKAPRLSFPDPSAFSNKRTLLFTWVFPCVEVVFALPTSKSHPQGLATLSMALVSFIPGSLFQLPTLLGFALQSFAPTQGSKTGFPIFSSLSRFHSNPYRL